MRIAIPTVGKRKLTNKVADTFSRAPSFTIVTIKDKEIKKVEVIENPALDTEKGAGPIAARTIKEQNVDVLLSGDLGPGAKNILEAFEIKVYPVKTGHKVKEIVETWLEI